MIRILQSVSANALNTSVFNALSIGSGSEAAVFLCINRGVNEVGYITHKYIDEGVIIDTMTHT